MCVLKCELVCVSVCGASACVHLRVCVLVEGCQYVSFHTHIMTTLIPFNLIKLK